METSPGKPFIGKGPPADPNIKRLPKRMIYKVSKRLLYVIFLKIFRFPHRISLLFSEFICIATPRSF